MIISNIVNGIDTRFKEITTFYKKVKMLITTKQITLYKVKSDVKEQLTDEDERWVKFCSELFEKDCIADRIFDELLEKDYPIEEISFIWHEDRFSEEKMEEFIKKSNTTLCPRNGKKGTAFIFDKKRWKRVEVHII